MRRFALACSVLLVGVAVGPAVGHGTRVTAPVPRVGAATCASGGDATTAVRRARDVVLGPVVLIGGRSWATSRPDAFGRRGFKIPATLPEGAEATLSIPAALRGRTGLVFSRATERRVTRQGVAGADGSVRFTACSGGARPARTGWPGGLVVDRPRCVTLTVAVAGAPAERRRIALGRRC